MRLAYGSLILLSLETIWLPNVVFAAPQNTTIDDHEAQIVYSPADVWSREPLIGYDSYIFDGTRSFTYSPGASATLVFTATGIFIQGPSAPDQAKRRVVLDGVDQGVYSWYAADRTPSAPFWGKTGLGYTIHTVVVSHADTTDKILVLDAFIVQSDPAQSTVAPTALTTTPATSATIQTPTTIYGSNDGMDMSMTMEKPSTIPIILGVLIPLLLICAVATLCLVRRRRRQREAHWREASKEPGTSTWISNPVYPASSPGENEMQTDVVDWRQPIINHGESEVLASSLPTNADVKRALSLRRPLPSYPYQQGGRTAADAYVANQPLGSPLLIPTRATTSSGHRDPAPPPYVDEPTMHPQQQPISGDEGGIDAVQDRHDDNPVVATPLSKSVFRRISTSLAGMVPSIRPLSRKSIAKAGAGAKGSASGGGTNLTANPTNDNLPATKAEP